MLEQALTILNKAFGEDNVELSEGQRIVLRLEPFQINNKLGDTHPIYGMWLSFHMNLLQDKLHVYDLKATRSMQTSREYNNHYYHSHIAGNRLSENDWVGFCIGHGDFAVQYTKMSAGGDIGDFIMFVMLLKNFVTFEDIDGVPFKYIRDLISIGSPIRIEPNSGSLLSLMQHRNVKRLHFDESHNLVNNEHNHKLILDTGVFEGYMQAYKIRGRYVSYRRIDNDEISLIPFELFRFKGEPVMATILPNPELEVIPPGLTQYLNPFLFEKISHHLKHKLNERTAKTGYEHLLATREAYSEAIRAANEQDRLYLSKNT